MSAYRLVTHDRSGREHPHSYTTEDSLTPGSVVLLLDRYWLVGTVDDDLAQAWPARYRLTLRHPDGHEETGVLRRFRADAPAVGHQLTTFEDGAPIAWQVIEQRLARDDNGDLYLESFAERDYTELESLPDHQLEHALEQDREDTGAASTALAQAASEGRAVELVALEAGAVPDWVEAICFIDSLVLDEVGDELIEQCGIDTGHVLHKHWLDRVKRRLNDDLDSFRADIEGPHKEIEEWDFHGSRIFAAIGDFDDDSNPSSGYGWTCRLVDASVLAAAGFYRARKPLLPL
jgi:hypothetical protein